MALLMVLTLLGFLWIATWNGQNEYDIKQISGTKEKKTIKTCKSQSNYVPLHLIYRAAPFRSGYSS